MKKIKAMNGYTIYQASARDEKKYECGSIKEAEENCGGNYARAREICESENTCVSFEEIADVENILDTLSTAGITPAEYTADGLSDAVDEMTAAAEAAKKAAKKAKKPAKKDYLGKYRPETVAACIADLRARVADWRKCANTIKLSISAGNTKIGRVMNVSIAPVVTCGNCSHCAPYCYDVNDCIFRGETVRNARAKNTALLLEDRAEYFRQIESAINRRRKNKYFRWHVGGEIIDVEYFAEMVEIARRHPDFIFWTYTKMHALVNAYVAMHGGSMAAAIPENLHVMFSVWQGMQTINPYGFPQFECILKGMARPVGYYCPGNCDVCKVNGHGCVNGESAFVDEH